jgi:hypothetical protein
LTLHDSPLFPSPWFCKVEKDSSNDRRWSQGAHLPIIAHALEGFELQIQRCSGLARLRGWETVLWAGDATWVIGLAMLRGEGRVFVVGSNSYDGVLRVLKVGKSMSCQPPWIRGVGSRGAPASCKG